MGRGVFEKEEGGDYGGRGGCEEGEESGEKVILGDMVRFLKGDSC